MWQGLNSGSNLSLIAGLVLAIFGIALLTQRNTLTLDRKEGKWTSKGSVFLLLSFSSFGSLKDVGPVRISEWAQNPRQGSTTSTVITYPVTVKAEKDSGGTTDLRFGRYWSLEEADEISAVLGKFLEREVIKEQETEKGDQETGVGE
jgi:hypothetical protein